MDIAASVALYTPRLLSGPSDRLGSNFEGMEMVPNEYHVSLSRALVASYVQESRFADEFYEYTIDLLSRDRPCLIKARAIASESFLSSQLR